MKPDKKQSAENAHYSSDNLKEQIIGITSKLQVDFIDQLAEDAVEEATDQILQLFQDYAEGLVPDRADGQSPELYGNYFDGYNHCRKTMLDKLKESK